MVISGVYKIVMEVASDITIHTKPCPKCHTPIDKNGGCVHMVCSLCHTAFCWKCGHEYEGTQYYHECQAAEKHLTVSYHEFLNMTDFQLQLHILYRHL